jgi:hypothetical protein
MALPRGLQGRVKAPSVYGPFGWNRDVPGTPPGGGYQNPYHSVEGFENYRHPLMRYGRGGDVFNEQPPNLERLGFPPIERVQEISRAQKALMGQSVFAPRSRGGQGLQAQNPDIMALLRERLGMGAV